LGIVQLDGLAGDEARALLCGAPVDPHGAALQQAARRRHAEPRHRRGNEVIDPGTGPFRLYPKARHAARRYFFLTVVVLAPAGFACAGLACGAGLAAARATFFFGSRGGTAIL
jgi:hypothetical protein